MQQGTARQGLAILMMTTAALITGLHLLGGNPDFRIEWADPVEWVGGADAEQAAIALLRYTGLVVGYWIVGSTAAYALANHRRLVGRVAARVALPGVRRMVDRALATALVASIATGPLQPVLADEQPPAPIVFDINSDGVPVPLIRFADDTVVADPPVVTPTEQPVAVSPPAVQPGSPALVAAPAAAPIAATSYTVVSGDNLWLIAAEQVGAEVENQPPTAAVSGYWRRLIDANRTTLRSGDPNLIYPGEIILLPRIEATP